LLDEPFAALDEITRFKLNDDLVALWRELGMTVVFVTHSVFESVFLSNRIVVMTGRPGRVSSELAVDTPARDAPFRTSAEYAGYCRVASEALASPRHERCACGSGGMNERALRILAPAGVLALGIVLWDLVVRINGIPPYILPSPGLVLSTLVADWPILWSSLLATLATTLEGLALAVAGGIGLAVLFNQSRLIEHSPILCGDLQVTPVVAIAPLLLIYLPQHAAVLACAWIGVFPVLANTTLD
jgi:hypothetical protein